ncbi:DUF29 domain-containing protein [Cronbergia sp. UHCC 0137]|uniref:DUF29 domain-containing protein n=1 Tax=Cronbergia sp. UHCC 0137 TaxID=3110239 RepID=UPI002B21B1F0|nr:DUF29 domain-containing protein [Cronbergia sp. UHCC 0137]MEA5620937.1 DUF29 domain-containing protein [Cronbergia sp. UHCC 0137]
MTVTINLQQLYNADDYQWLLATIDLLKQNRFDELDLGNLIEELEDLGNERKNAVESLLQQIIRHLLLYQYWQNEIDRNSGHWQAEIYGFRDQLNAKITTNLRNHLIEQRLKIYARALGYVQRKTNYQVDFPTECPYSFEQLLDINYLPTK